MSDGYIAQSTGPRRLIKVGQSRNPVNRMKGLRRECGESVRLLALYLSGSDLEMAFKRRFKAHRAFGEWHYPHQDIADWFAGEARRGAFVTKSDVSPSFIIQHVAPIARRHVDELRRKLAEAEEITAALESGRAPEGMRLGSALIAVTGPAVWFPETHGYPSTTEPVGWPEIPATNGPAPTPPATEAAGPARAA